ncbi:unnamed protein product, partial [Scytosiphon promiscuus]
MGFLSCLGLGRPTNRARPVSRDSSGDTPSQSAPATASSWTAYRDAQGRPCWRNNLTGLWTFNNPRGGGNAHGRFRPVPAQPPVQFWPASPYPGAFHHPAPWSTVVPVSPVLVFPPMAPQPPPLTEEWEDDDKKDDDKAKKGRWEEVYSEENGEK